MQIEFSIGHLARETGCKVTTIRYYETIGLLPKPRRSDGNTRIYEKKHLTRLSFIQHCKNLGFSQGAVREMLELTEQPDRSCGEVTAIASGHLASVERRISQLITLRSKLEIIIASCSGGKVEQCQIVEALKNSSRLQWR